MSTLDDDILRRTPPQNLEAEQAAIGAVILDNERYEAVAEVVTGADFYLEKHRTVWTAIEALIAAHQPVDAITLSEALRPQLEAIGGPSYFAEMAATVPTPSMARHYGELVRDKATQRNLAQFGTEVASAAYQSPLTYSPDRTEEMIAVAEYELAAIASRGIRKPEPGKAETLSAALWAIEHRVENAVPTGLATLDRGFGGFSVGHLTILAARTSRGKTALAVQMAINAARAGYSTAFFGLEQPTEEMWVRGIGCIGQVDMFAARRRGFRDDERARVEQARMELEALPLEILYRPSMRPRDFRLECRRLAREKPIKLAVIDYFNLMRGDRREKERWREMQEAVLALKEIAGELGIPFCSYRNSTGRPTRKPRRRSRTYAIRARPRNTRATCCSSGRSRPTRIRAVTPGNRSS